MLLALLADLLLAGVERALTPWARGRAHEPAAGGAALPQRPVQLDADAILELLGEHLRISALAVLAAMVLAIPAGMLRAHRQAASSLSNVSRAVPTLALLTIFAVTLIGFGPTATTIALAVFAFPPILTNTYVDSAADRDVVEASRAMGFSEWQVATSGTAARLAAAHDRRARTAAVQVVATATLAALVAGGGLGRIITRFPPAGLRRGLAGAILVARSQS